jgi:hypothetical protein
MPTRPTFPAPSAPQPPAVPTLNYSDATVINRWHLAAGSLLVVGGNLCCLVALVCVGPLISLIVNMFLYVFWFGWGAPDLTGLFRLLTDYVPVRTLLAVAGVSAMFGFMLLAARPGVARGSAVAVRAAFAAAVLAAAGLLALAAGLSLLAVKGMSADRIPLFVLAGMVAAAAGPLLVLALLLFRAGRPRVGAPR